MRWQVGLPRAVQLVIDDVGWREGWRLDHAGGPFRAGVDRLLGLADYQAIVDLGAALQIRPTAAMILCEWDRENVCARYPTSTAAGAAWDNASRRGEWSDQAAELFRERAAHLELALHGVGHEHWSDGRMTRAEWHGQGQRWPWDVLQGHLECFTALLDQHGLGPAAGHRFPVHFVPCAFQYLWDTDDPRDTGALVAGAGVRYCSTPFASLDRRSPLLADGLGLDHGVVVIDRGRNGVPWHACDATPDQLLGEVPDNDVEVLARAPGGSPEIDAKEVELLLARRPRGDEADRLRLITAHLPLATAVARLHLGQGASAVELLAAGAAGLAKAVDTFDETGEVGFENHAEACVRAAVAELLSRTGEVVATPAAEAVSICGIHWPNLLRADPAENGQAVARWTAWLRRVGDQPGQVLAANARECFAQTVYRAFGRVEGLDDGFVLDLTELPEAALAAVGDLPVMVEVSGFTRLGRVAWGGLTPVWYRRQGSRAFVGLRPPGRVRAAVTFHPEAGPLQPVVYREGTYNVLDLRSGELELEIDVEVYGAQVVTVAPGFPPGQVEVTAGDLTIVSRHDVPSLGVVRLMVRGRDIQGSPGTITLRRG